MSRRWQLLLTAVVFIGWLSYLGYAALSKNRGPVISRAQAAAAKYAIVADVSGTPQGQADQYLTVVESLGANSLPAGTRQFVTNIADAGGFEGPGQYLLLLAEDPSLLMIGDEGAKLRPLSIVGQQRSPGNDLTGVGPPKIYRWTEETRKQFDCIPKPSEPPG
jgi:hypothetical protein